MRVSFLAAALLALLSPTFATAAEALPDAQVVRISLRGGDIRVGDRVGLTVEVKNAGNAPLPRVPVVLTVDGAAYSEWMLPRELAPGEQTTWKTVFSGDRGMHLVAATVDPLDQIREGDKTNNAAFINVGVGDRRPPFPWAGLVFGVLFFILGIGAGGLLRRPDSIRVRRQAHTPTRRMPGKDRK
jgi:subtilase family serine protease